MRSLNLLALAGVAIAIVVPEPSAAENDVFLRPEDLPDTSDLDDGLDKSWMDDIPSNEHGRSNLTVYEAIMASKHTTTLAKLISRDPELVDILNRTDSTLTLFAPTDEAFEKFPKRVPKPDKKLIKRALLNHISGDVYPVMTLATTYTVPTLLEEKSLGGHQRLTVKFARGGLVLNHFSKIVAANIYTANGVIHAVDHIVLLPPPTLPTFELAPSTFSTLAFGLVKTGLFKELSETPHVGSTAFAPTNHAFQKLGLKINAFLFSKYGAKYLKALLQYHVVLSATLYSDAFYHDHTKTPWSDDHTLTEADEHSTAFFHLDLPTQLRDYSIPVDIYKFGRLIRLVVNGVKVAYSDVPTKDGVIHVVNSVLIPPRKHSQGPNMDFEELNEEWDVDDLKERLEPFLDQDTEDENIDLGIDDEFIAEQVRLGESWTEMDL